MDQYYSGENNTIQRGAVRSILDSVVAELVDNPNHTFTWVEQVGWSCATGYEDKGYLAVWCPSVLWWCLTSSFCATASGPFVIEIVASRAQILQLCCAHEATMFIRERWALLEKARHIQM